jgi:uncharacterized secreted protein with C-terminal beta-propeller domain
MTRVRRWSYAAGTALLLLSGCTGEAAAPDPVPAPAGRFQLVAFDSCAEALTGLKQAASAVVGPWGFGGVARAAAMPDAAGERAAANSSAGTPADAVAPSYSGTNTHEAGVDEPDMVKTDGRRIVTVTRGVLHVVDPSSRRVTGRLDLAEGADETAGWHGGQLLLHGDHALVLTPDHTPAAGEPRPDGIVARPMMPYATAHRFLLVDLAGAPRIVSSYRFDGSLVDARQVGPTARVVVRSVPRLEFPVPGGEDRRSDGQRIAENRRVIEESTLDDWLPRYETSNGAAVTKGQVGCEHLSRPTEYTGTSMLTVLSFDLAGTSLGDGQPTTVVADGQTVYSNGASLYVTSDQQWRTTWWDFDPRRFTPDEQTTDIYRFDTSQPGRPRFAGAGSVPGWLVNQYALSEWEGHLRVATTSGELWNGERPTSSSVYVLRVGDSGLDQVGQVGGLGKGERIYAVRFAGATGYVVTFRQVDPLYTVDLSRPATPRVVGELKITGYSAYLHPADGGRLIGVGQEASAEGRTRGAQVSLFDVSDVARPVRLAQHHVEDGYSEAEFDPHAFLYWPADGLLVVPLVSYVSGRENGGGLVLRVSGDAITELGLVRHPGAGSQFGSAIRRSLMIDGALWTLSDAGLRATDPSSMKDLGWLAL